MPKFLDGQEDFPYSRGAMRIWKESTLGSSSRARLGVALFAIALFMSLGRAVRLPSHTGDQFWSLAAGRSFFSGQGMKETWANADNVADTFSRPHMFTAPLTALWFGALDSIVRSPVRTFILSDVIGVVLFFWAFFLLTRMFFPPGSPTMLCFWGLWIVADPLAHARADEPLTAGLFFMGLAILCDASRRSPGRISLFLGGVSGLLMGLCSGLRYAYWPLAGLVPVAALFLVERNRPVAFRAACTAAAVCCLVFVSVVSVNIGRSGFSSTLHYYSQGARLHWHQLLTMFPFPSAAVGFNSGIDLIAGLPVVAANMAKVIVSIVVLAALVRMGLWLARSPDRDEGPLSLLWLFMACGGVIFAATLGMLVYLSVRYNLPFSSVSEARYYIPIGPFLTLAVAWVLMNKGKGSVPWLRVLLGVVLIFSLPNFYTRLKNLTAGSSAYRYWQERRSQEELFRTFLAQVPTDRARVYVDLLPDAADADQDFWGRVLDSHDRWPIAMAEGYRIPHRAFTVGAKPIRSLQPVHLVVAVRSGKKLNEEILGVSPGSLHRLGSTAKSDVYWVADFMTPDFFDAGSSVLLPHVDLPDQQAVLERRRKLIRFIWSQTGPLSFFTAGRLPDRRPDFVEENLQIPEYRGLPNLDRVDRWETVMPHNVRSVNHFFRPRVSNGRLAICHAGHRQRFEGALFLIGSLLERGYHVVGISMPLEGRNKGTAAQTADGTAVLLSDHNKLFLLETEELNPIRFFMDPVLAGVNQALTVQDFQSIAMMGLSGGGWTTTVYAALDPRVTTSIAVAGSLPLPLRASEGMDRGDMEETWPPLYAIADYPSLYTLAGAGRGRAHVHIINLYDPCCFGGERYKRYEPDVRSAVERLKGRFRVIVDGTHRDHTVSDFAVKEILKELGRP